MNELRGKIKFANPGTTYAKAMAMGDAVCLTIQNNIEIKEKMFLDKKEAVSLAIELLVSAQAICN